MRPSYGSLVARTILAGRDRQRIGAHDYSRSDPPGSPGTAPASGDSDRGDDELGWYYEASESEADATALGRATGRDGLRQRDTDDDGGAGLAAALIRERADETLKKTSSAADTGKTENRTDDGGEPEEHGAVSALSIMFGTSQDACFFTAVTLSGMGKGVIDTFLFVW